MSQSPLSQATDDRLTSMLFQGEEIEEDYALDSVHVAVTTHRVLVFSPEGDADGRLFDHADRPNVLDASVRTTGQDSYAEWGVRTAIYGAVLLGGGVLLESSGILDAIEGTSSADGTVAGGAATGAADLFALFPEVLGALTSVFLLCGALLLLGAGALGGLYATSRSEELVIERAGQDPIRVPTTHDDGEQVARGLRTAVGTASNPAGD